MLATVFQTRQQPIMPEAAKVGIGFESWIVDWMVNGHVLCDILRQFFPREFYRKAGQANKWIEICETCDMFGSKTLAAQSSALESCDF